MKYVLLLSLVFFSFYFEARATKVFGKVSNETGEVLPFLTVYVEGTNYGTTSNGQGDYFLELPKGKYTVSFRFVGYQTQTHALTVADKDLELNVKMQAQSLTLREVEVRATDEDPAYAIIRNAQAMRKFYLSQVDAYNCRVYIKGINRLVNVPKKILGKEIVIEGLDKNRSGVTYLSESVSQYYFQAPDKQKEVMISSKVSGSNRGFSWNSARAFQFDFYQSSVELGDRPFISPIAPTAFVHYKYKYLGEFKDNNFTVNKIQVIPRASNSPAYSGFIYVQDSTWRIHAAELYITEGRGIDFVDSIRIKQTYIPITDEVWMRSAQSFDYVFSLDMFKIKGNGTFGGTFSNYQLPARYYTAAQKNKTQPQPLPSATLANKSKKSEKQITKAKAKELIASKQKANKTEKDSANKFFGNEIMRVEPLANTRTASYWDSIRPMPLTIEEMRDYTFKDSIRVIKESKPYRDSVDRIRNKFKPINLLTGYSYNHSFRKLRWNVVPPMQNIQFNTIEGYALNAAVNMEKYDDSLYRYTNFGTVLRYGFSSQRFYGKFNFRHRFNAVNRAFVAFDGGNFIQQFNELDPINPIINSIYSLTFEENYLKIYEKAFAKLSFGRELTNGISFVAFTELSRRSALTNAENLPTFMRRNVENREFTSNNPQDQNNDAPAFEAFNALRIGATLNIRFGQKYLNRPHLKVNVRSPYPKLSIYYERGIAGILNSKIDYDFVKITVFDDITLGLIGNFLYDLSAGAFLSDKNIPFIDFKHFNTTQVFFKQNTFRAFFNLPYYANSTNGSFAEAHVEHHFNGFLTNSIPLFKKLNWHFVAGAHALTTSNLNYGEATVGIEKILKIIRADYVFSFDNQNRTSSAFRLHIDL